MIIKFDKFLNESPDTCYIGVDSLSYRTYGAFPFGFYKGKCYVGDYNATHYEIYKNLGREDYENAGRIWSEQKIITFWSINKVKSLKSIIEDINDVIDDKFGITIDDTWLIEVYDKNSLYRSELYNLFDFIKICAYGYNSKWSISANDEYDYKYRNKKDNDIVVNVRDFLPSNPIYLDNLYKKKIKNYDY